MSLPPESQELLLSPPPSLGVVRGHHELGFTMAARSTLNSSLLVGSLWGLAAIGAFLVLASWGWTCSAMAVPVLLFPTAPLLVAHFRDSHQQVRLSAQRIVIGSWSADLVDVRSCSWSSYTTTDGLTKKTLTLWIGAPWAPEVDWWPEAWTVALDEAEGRWLSAAILALAQGATAEPTQAVPETLRELLDQDRRGREPSGRRAGPRFEQDPGS